MTVALERRVLALLLGLSLAGSAWASGRVSTAKNVALTPIVEHIDLVTDMSVVGKWVFIATQPGLLLRKDLNSGVTSDARIFLDISARVGRLGAHIPSLGGLGYPVAGTYDERGLLGFVAHPHFDGNSGTFWVWYSNINERSANPPNFFQWTTEEPFPGQTAAPAGWNMSEYDHVDYVDEYRAAGGKATFQRTLLKVKRPFFNHTGFQSLVWSPEHQTLLLGLGDGGSEYDPANLAQDDRQLSGKLLKVDLSKLIGRDFRGARPVATFADLAALGVADAFTPLAKGLRNPSRVSFETVGDDDQSRWIRYLANTGQDTIEFAHAFDHDGVNFGFRPWEGIFPTAWELDINIEGSDSPTSSRVIAYGLEASRMPNIYRPFVQYTHLDKQLGPNANTGSTLYRGNGIPGLKGDLVFTDWISFAQSPPQGLLLHARADRRNLQVAQPVERLNVTNLKELGIIDGRVIFYTSINTDRQGERIFVGGYRDIQFIVNQRDNALGSEGLAGGLYEVVNAP